MRDKEARDSIECLKRELNGGPPEWWMMFPPPPGLKKRISNLEDQLEDLAKYFKLEWKEQAGWVKKK